MAARVNELHTAMVAAKNEAQTEKVTLNQLQDKQAEAKSMVNGLLKKQSASAAAPTEDEAKALANAESAYAAFDARISAQRKLVAQAERTVLDAETAYEAEKAAIAAEDARLAAQPSGRVQVDAPNAGKDPKRGFASHKDFMGAVMAAGMGRREDERLKPLATVGSDEQGVYSNPVGGYLVPAAIAPGILSVAPEDDPLLPLVTKVPMSAPTVTYNARVDKNHTSSVSGGFTVTRRPETVDGSASRMTFEQITLTANEEFGLAFATERILMDSPESFVAIIAAGFKDDYAAFAMNERINGAGTGERLGFLNSPAKIDVTKETGQAAATIVKENIDKMQARCWKYGRAVWLANHNTRPQLKSLVQVVGTGGNAVPYFQTSGEGQATLDGRPLFFSEFAKTLGTSGDLILVVPSEYLEGQYESEQYAESIHVRFAAAERAFRFYRRTDGRPWWTSALTPKNGSTLSPVVTLATRA